MNTFLQVFNSISGSVGSVISVALIIILYTWKRGFQVVVFVHGNTTNIL
ncbi:MAG: hypothetical protein HYS44_03655 [Candidatus Niyogibacteria bacterium]|nr:hypothetical protein [Candidatus Niyogibacteria bacterium]